MEDKLATQMVKCVVWDLDNTLWSGVLLEGDPVAPKPGVVETIAGLDDRGILQSIASRNDYELAMTKLKTLALDEYFLYPQISWQNKSSSLKAISNSLNIGLDSLVFIDDEAFERDEVRRSCPEVRCIDALDVRGLLALPEMNPSSITGDTKARRKMYLNDMARNTAEAQFSGPQEEFLAGLNMHLTIARAMPEDLNRVQELTVRTHQLNTTGYTYSYDELKELAQSPQHDLLICQLEDNYGTYGKIGLALLERFPSRYILKLLLMSCRVMSRGIGSILINYIMREARSAGVTLLAEFVSNERNRAMYITLKLAGFHEISRRGNKAVLQADLSRLQNYPGYVRVDVLQNFTDSIPALAPRL